MVARMQAAVEDPPEELPTTPRTFRRLLRRPGRRQILLGCLPLIFALSLGLSMQVYTRRTRPHRLSVWGWVSKGRSRPTSDSELDIPVVAMNTSACEWEGGTDYLDQLPARRHFWGSWSRVPVRTEPQQTCPSHTGPALKTAAYSRRRRYTRQRPLDVNRWTCAHVAQWLGEQRWHWSELSQYQSRICAVGVDGATLYFVDEYDLEQDLQIGYRLHRKLVLDAIGSLKEQQPDGTAEPGNLWEYIHDDPTTAALYVSGVLCTPRLTMLWLHTFEYNSTLGPLLADEDESNDQVAYHAPRSIQEFLVLFPIRANKILFWIGWLCCPALMVAYHALRCAEINLLVSAYVIAISISKQFTEWHSLCETLLRTQMSISDKLASWVCSHLMTPALSMMLAVLHLVFSQVMPGWACNALFWVRIFVLPPLSIWASWASWVPLPPASEEGDVFTPGPTAGTNRTQRASSSSTGGNITPSCFWPEPLSIPAELDDCPDVPASFRCPITYEIMREPAIALSGHTYEREAIVTWLSGLQAHADPVTKAPIDPGQIAPNLALRSVILDWLWRNFNVRGTPHAAHSLTGCNTATPLSAAGPSSNPLHGIMRVPLAHPGSPAYSLRGSVFNSSASGVWGSSMAHNSTAGAGRTDSAGQNPSGSGAAAGAAHAASAGTSAEQAQGPFAASVDDLLIRSASDGALHFPSGFVGSMHSLLHDCRCLKCTLPHTAGSCTHLAGTAQLPTGPREILQDRANTHSSWHGLPATPMFRDSARRFGMGAKARSCGSASVQSMWSYDVCHGSTCCGSGSASAVSTSMMAPGVTGGGSSPADLTDLAAPEVPCSSSGMAVNSFSEQGSDSASKGAAPLLPQCTETCASSDCPHCDIAVPSQSEDGADAVLVSSPVSVGLRCRIPGFHATTKCSLQAQTLGGYMSGADSECAPFSPSTMSTSGNLRCVGRSPVGTPISARARAHTSPHEDACDLLSKSRDPVQHPRARSETSRNVTSCGNMQLLLQQQAQAAALSGGPSGLPGSPTFMRFSASSGWGNEGSSRELRTIRSQPPLRGASPRHTSDVPCVTCMHRSAVAATPTSSASPLMSSVECCHSGSRQQRQDGQSPTGQG